MQRKEIAFAVGFCTFVFDVFTGIFHIADDFFFIPGFVCMNFEKIEVDWCVSFKLTLKTLVQIMLRVYRLLRLRICHSVCKCHLATIDCCFGVLQLCAIEFLQIVLHQVLYVSRAVPIHPCETISSHMILGRISF